ncbi:TPA: hypothetical protein ACF2S4_001847 [Legionella pneumophila]|mgnify:CR=1 FL=1|uniref:Transmembrane protein n=3 Tax=Legionella TaxID=445 RepID=A0A378PGD0_9GAMM|nr:MULTISPECIES: hypothetical protein [Legionella]KTD70621.1 hypothetical protein Lstg_3106 [Legionella steigerwaltii]MCL9684188.1 hypothetical protein [Legionella maioricensis]MCL9686905.1 hypothetical protein [Legionella maioricensis]STY85853.1 Uncharacterised protein [Legionella steigerwaltii]
MSYLRSYNYLIAINRLFALTLFMGASLSFPAHSGPSKSFRVAHTHGKTKPQRISPTVKHSKFLTGLAAGSILFSQKGHPFSYNKPDFESPDGELYSEYERNNQLLTQGGLPQDKRLTLERRNQQIKNRLIALAEKRYMSAFTLQLVPLKEKVIESKIEKSYNPNEKPDIQVKRKQLLYELRFSDESPKPISDFDVVNINEMKPNNTHPYQFTYSETWGDNAIKVNLRDKKDKKLVLELSHAYYVPNAARKDIFESMREKFVSYFLYVWPFLFLPLLLNFFFKTK